MSSEPAVEVCGLSKRYEMYASPQDRLRQFLSLGRRTYYQEFWALRDVSFHVEPGETFGILGRNGSGKSTLLQIVAGTLSATNGEVRTRGLVTALLELGAGFNHEFTGRENVYLSGSLLGFKKEEIDELFDSIAAFADIGPHLDQPVKTYSSGMYVRLAFAVQACVDPQVLIVDEALSVGDEKFQRKCFEHIEKLRTNNCAILLVTHSTHTVEKFCRRAALLHKGSLHGVGSAKDIVDQYHALLYSDEKAYLRFLNTTRDQGNPENADGKPSRADGDTEAADPGDRASAEGRLDAAISKWCILNAAGEPCEAFVTGDLAVIRFLLSVFTPLTEIQSGILMRTVEGVSAFGTSTSYHQTNIHDSQPGQTYLIEFRVHLTLCSGVYFVTLAAAEAISHSDMRYLDRKTDAIVIHINDYRPRGTGIAALSSTVTAKLMQERQ